MTFTIHPGPIHAELESAFRRLEERRFADALWSRRLDVWSSDLSVQQKIANRLGWLDSLDFVTPHLPRLLAFADSVRQSGFTDVVLLGMGGSSLAPDVLRAVYGVAPAWPTFHVLDSVDPDAVRDAMANAASSLFIFASKSGSTIEPNVMAAEAERRIRDAGIPEPGSRFIAITDEGTALYARARAGNFRDIFVNPSDIGGRYSALSFFGLVPAALMGIDLAGLVSSARTMAEACRIEDPRRNPGLALGAMMAAGARAGRDKLTLDLPPRLARFALWVEQLVAESTGKQGKGVVPIAGEAPDAPIGTGRIVVQAGQGRDWGETPRATLDVQGDHALGAEFFRWEVATAAAGLLLDINPFDEPNVQQAKDATRALLDIYVAQGRLPVPEADATIERVRVTRSKAARQGTEQPSAFFTLVRPSDYVALLAFLPPDEGEFAEALGEVRREVAQKKGVATTLGFGPRYLHSTGQLHKGGPNSGVFLIITADPASDLPIPGEAFTFGILEMAQALGDFESLNRAGRRALHLHLPSRDGALLRRVCGVLLESSSASA